MTDYFKGKRVRAKGRPPTFIYEDCTRDQQVDAKTSVRVSAEPLRLREPINSDPLFVQVLLMDANFETYDNPAQRIANPSRRQMVASESLNYLYAHKLYARLPQDTGPYKKGDLHRMVAFYTDTETGVLRAAETDQFDVVGHPSDQNQWVGLRETQGMPYVVVSRTNGKSLKVPYVADRHEDIEWTGHLPSGLKFQYQPAFIYQTRDRMINSDGSLGEWTQHQPWRKDLLPDPEIMEMATNPATHPYCEVVRHPSGIFNGQVKKQPFYREYTLALAVNSRGSLRQSGRIHGAAAVRFDDTYSLTATNQYGSFTYNWYVEVDDATPAWSSRSNIGGGPAYRKQGVYGNQGVSDFAQTHDGNVVIELEVGQAMDIAVPQMMEGNHTLEAEADLQVGMDKRVRHFGQTQMWQVYTRYDDKGPWCYNPDGLPRGLVCDALTGVISGTPEVPTTRCEVKILARNNMFKVVESAADRQARLQREASGQQEPAFVNSEGERIDFRDDGGDACTIYITVRAVEPTWIGFTYMKAVYSVGADIAPNHPNILGSPDMFMQACRTNTEFTPYQQGGNNNNNSVIDTAQEVLDARRLPDGLEVDQRNGSIFGRIQTPNNQEPIISVDVGPESPFYEVRTLRAIERYGPFAEEPATNRSPQVQREECFHKFLIDMLTEVQLDHIDQSWAKTIVIHNQTRKAYIRSTYHVFLKVVDLPPLIRQYTSMHPRYQLNEEVTPNQPLIQTGHGGNVDEFEVINLPPGLVLDRYTGCITGCPLKVTSLRNKSTTEIMAKNSGGQCHIQLHITVLDSVPVIEHLVRATNMKNAVALPVQSHESGLRMTEVEIDVTNGKEVQIELYPRVGGCNIDQESCEYLKFTMEGHPPGDLQIDARCGAITGRVHADKYLQVTHQVVRIRCTNTAGPSQDHVVKFVIFGDGAPVPEPTPHQEQRPMKILLLGDSGVGKTTIQQTAMGGRAAKTKYFGGQTPNPYDQLGSPMGSNRPVQCTQIRIDHPDGRGGKLCVELWDALDNNAASYATGGNAQSYADSLMRAHPHIRQQPADGAIVVFSAENQAFPEQSVRNWLQALDACNKRQRDGDPVSKMLMMNKIDRIQAQPGQSPHINIDERLAVDFRRYQATVRNSLETTAEAFARTNDLQFAMTCALDDRNVDKYYNNEGHTIYAAVNIMAQKIYAIERRLDWGRQHDFNQPAQPDRPFVINRPASPEFSIGCTPRDSNDKQCSIQ